MQKQISFIVEIDKLKEVYRRSFIMEATRNENDAEHTWHLAMMAVLLTEYVDTKDLDLLRVLKMILIHDLVEIDAGDTFAYDPQGQLDKKDREERAAERIFNLLPKDQAEEVFALWREFETGQTEEAKYAHALDKLQPVLQNYYTQGKSWRQHKVSSNQVLARVSVIKDSSVQLWKYTVELIEDAIKKGFLQK